MQHKNNPFIIGLTGGIGSGKSAAANHFTRKGIAVVDADEVSHKISEQSSIIDAIKSHFGPEAINEFSKLNRRYLRERIFNNDAERLWLETLLHPKIRAQIHHELQQATSPYVILSAPLLLENELDKITGRVLVIDVPESLQIARATARDNAEEGTVAAIIAKQISRSNRLARADDVIDNSGNLDNLQHAIDKLHERYLCLAKQCHENDTCTLPTNHR